MTYRKIIEECSELNIEKEAIMLLIMERLNIKRHDLLLSLDKEVDSIIMQDVEKLKLGIPVQYILGYTYFYKSKFYVNPSVLIPRFDTEILVDEVIKTIDTYFNNEKVRLVDIGTGSGCIAISIKKERTNVILDAIDISKDALEIAKQNSIYNQTTINFIHNDLLNDLDTKYDVIVSNPPYIDINEQIDSLVVNNEPSLALFSDNKGLYHYEQILIQSKQNLNDGGFILFEIPSNRDDEILQLVNKYYDINKVDIVKDYNHLSRVLIIRS